MSTESNFINELKYDVKKDNIKQFIFQNLNKILFIIITIFILSISYMLMNVYEANKIEKTNKKLFEIMASSNVKEQLKNLYYDESIPEISRTFTGFNLINTLTFDESEIGTEKIKRIYNDIFENEKELFFKYYAGLNLLILEINEHTDTKKIENLMEKLLVKQNPLMNFVLEQKALFLIGQNKYEEAKNILVDLLRKNLDTDSRERINQYLLYLN